MSIDVGRRSAVALALALSVALSLVSVTPAGAQETACPADVPSEWFTDTVGNTHRHAIDCIVAWGITQGVAPGRYAPARTVNRAQLASFVARLIENAGGSLPAPSPQGFTDIDGNVHADRINQLAAAGVVQGTTSTTYTPDAAVRRDQMATFLVRAYEHVASTELPDPPSDFPDIDGNAHEDNINRAAAAGFTTGTGDGSFAPRRRVRRDQMGGFLARVLEHLVAEGHAEPPDAWSQLPADVTLPGVTFDLPGDAQQWDEQPRSAPTDDYEAAYRGSFATSLTVVMRDAPTIDRALEDQEAFYDEHDYDVPDPWYEPVTVRGADRAVVYDYISPSGDLLVSELVLEADGIPVHFTYAVYIEDDDAPSHEQWGTTVQSIRVDPAELRAAIASR